MFIVGGKNYLQYYTSSNVNIGPSTWLGCFKISFLNSKVVEGNARECSLIISFKGECVCVYVCMYVCMCVYMCVCVCVCVLTTCKDLIPHICIHKCFTYTFS